MRLRTDGAVFALVLSAVVAVVAAVWVASGVQAGLTERAADRQAASGALLTAMLDQETGLRGYIASGRGNFLAPYSSGRLAFNRAAGESRRLEDGDRSTARSLATVVAQAREWQRLAAPAVDTARREGPGKNSLRSSLTRKQAMDRFRRSQRSYAVVLDDARAHGTARARRLAVLVVVGLGLFFCAVGVLVIRWVRRVRAAEDHRYQRLVHSLPDAGILTFDHDLRFMSVDGSALDALGWTDRDVVGSRLEDLVAPGQLAELTALYQAALAGRTERLEFDSETTGQSWGLEISPLRRANDSIAGGMVLLRNISERRAAERDTAQRTRDLERLGTVARDLAHAGDALEIQRILCVAARQIATALTVTIWVPDGHGKLVSQVAEGMPPVAAQLPIAGNPHGATHCLTTAEPLLITDAAHSSHCDPELVKAAGCHSLYFAPIVDNDTAVGVLAISWTERVETLSRGVRVALDMLCHEGAIALDRVALLARLDDLARSDPLTGLANRRVWDEQLALEISRARRDHKPFAVAMLDIDHFKAYNDSRGHPAGDRLLRTLSAALTGQLRDTDTVARLGGEEFGVLLPRCDTGAARTLLSRLRGVVPDDQTCSAGYAVRDLDESAEQLVKRADEALYEAKRTGRNRTCEAPLAKAAWN